MKLIPLEVAEAWERYFMAEKTCLNCKHDWPNAAACESCEQPGGPFTERTGWTAPGREVLVILSRTHVRENLTQPWLYDVRCTVCGWTGQALSTSSMLDELDSHQLVDLLPHTHKCQWQP